jgi:hypothetical protein
MATRIERRGRCRRAARAVDEDAGDAEALCNMAKLFASEEILKSPSTRSSCTAATA